MDDHHSDASDGEGMDGFEVRGQFKEVLASVSQSQQAVGRVASFAMRKGLRRHTLVMYRCIRDRLAATATLNRLPLLYILDNICQASRKRNDPSDWLDLVAKDLAEIVQEIVPEKEPVNAPMVKKCIKVWRAKSIFHSEILDPVERRISDLLTKPTITPGERAFTSKEIMRRIEEDRDRHKRAREEGWYRPDPAFEDPHFNPAKRGRSGSLSSATTAYVDEFAEAWEKIPAPNLEGDREWDAMKEDLDRFDAEHPGLV
ncbi:hypothetical protein HDU98_011544 [Podochytrium sp. JEL0797]|nr:hypothetical protein HDU98_011544 [Podochytrium sp. JEL0797]